MCALIVAAMVIALAIAEGICMFVGALVFIGALLVLSCISERRSDVKRFHAMRHCDLWGYGAPHRGRDPQDVWAEASQGHFMGRAYHRPPPPPRPSPEQ